ncbi:hypothetical protein Tco_0636041 [Tanacetum coccineum]
MLLVRFILAGWENVSATCSSFLLYVFLLVFIKVPNDGQISVNEIDTRNILPDLVGLVEVIKSCYGSLLRVTAAKRIEVEKVTQNWMVTFPILLNEKWLVHSKAHGKGLSQIYVDSERHIFHGMTLTLEIVPSYGKAVSLSYSLSKTKSSIDEFSSLKEEDSESTSCDA